MAPSFAATILQTTLQKKRKTPISQLPEENLVGDFFGISLRSLNTKISAL